MTSFKGILLSIAAISAFATAQAETAQPQQVVGSTEIMGPLTANNIRIFVERGIQYFEQVIQDTDGYSTEQKTILSRELEESAQKLRDQLDLVYSSATEMGNRSYPVGIIISYSGGLTLPFYLPAVQAGGGAEAGVAFFMKKNTYFLEGLRWSSVLIGGGKVDLGKDKVADPSKSDATHGITVKIIYVRDSESRPALTLKDFEGFYTGANVKTGLFGGRDLGEIYTKPLTCKYLNPLECDFYIYGLTVYKFGSQAKPTGLGGAVKEIYLDFPHDKEGRGYSF